MRPPEVGEDEIALRKSAQDGRESMAPSSRALADGLRGFDLHALIADATGPLTAVARQKELAIEVKRAERVPREVVGDADRIGTVLTALLENAVTLTERGEVVASVTSRETGSGRAVVHFEISDTGSGIPPEALDGPTEGGLARARELVERMDGRLDCASAAGLGSTVSFRVPVDLPARG